MILEISAITISVLSLLLSAYVVVRERKNKKFDTLLKCRERLLDIFSNQPTLTPDDYIFMEENPDSDFADLHRTMSSEITAKADKEFELMCYLVLKKQIDFNVFFDIFKGFIMGRLFLWSTTQAYKQNNLPNTWKIVTYCLNKKLIKPIKK
ncbi:hypothetical protein HYV44_02650 [Candidatus Microgenomates bacterium]|nr:hypothetical protein [Candidatus Microgenomates bacterium]